MKSGDVLGSKYRLVQRIGEGAMGEVWSGENMSTGRKVALKLIIHTAPKNSTHELRQRMLREARACGSLAHRNIVQILDVGETPAGDPFLVLELLRGRTLSERLKDTRRIEPTMAARIGADIANALAVAHAAKIIHRDLKPANIFLHHEGGDSDERFVVKILDFGVSKNLDGGNEGPATVTNMAVGSPAYMSPEQVALRKDLDGRTDIWSLGVVLYEMLTGGRPFTGGVNDVVRQIVLTNINKVPAPSTKVRDVSSDFDAIVARCLENDRARRYGDAAEVARALLGVAEAGVPMRVSGTLTRQAAQEAKAAIETTPMEARVPTPIPIPQVQTRTPTFTRMGTEQMPNPESLRGAVRTDVMSAQPPAASAVPTWRNEMAAWRAKRESDATQAGAVEELHGGTQPLGPVESTGTTSGLGALSKPDFEPFGETVVRVNKRKQDSRILFALMGVGLIAVIMLVSLIVHVVQSADAQPNNATPVPSSAPVPKGSAPLSHTEAPGPSGTVGPVSAEMTGQTAPEKPSVEQKATARAVTRPSTKPLPTVKGPAPNCKNTKDANCKKSGGGSRTFDYFNKSR